MPWQKGWRMYRREENGVSNVIGFEWRQAAKLAQEGGYDYFTTTLSISPLKNAGKINEIGQELAQIYKVEHLPSDFKKKNGYKRSIELSHEYGLYRQNYCGCVFSKRESMERESRNNRAAWTVSESHLIFCKQ